MESWNYSHKYLVTQGKNEEIFTTLQKSFITKYNKIQEITKDFCHESLELHGMSCYSKYVYLNNYNSCGYDILLVIVYLMGMACEIDLLLFRLLTSVEMSVITIRWKRFLLDYNVRQSAGWRRLGKKSVAGVKSEYIVTTI